MRRIVGIAVLMVAALLAAAGFVREARVTADMAWSDIPTCKETGVDVEYQMLRGIFLPPAQFEAWFLSTAFSCR